MAKFCGKIGYATYTGKNGVVKEGIEERTCRGDVNRNMRQLDNGQWLNDDIHISNEISIVADAYAFANFHRMRYVIWHGTKWKISSAEVDYPRITLSLGGVYTDATEN